MVSVPEYKDRGRPCTITFRFFKKTRSVTGIIWDVSEYAIWVMEDIITTTRISKSTITEIRWQ